jgi:hypothetical protein
MQVAVIEFARNQLGFPEANSEEFNPKAKPAVIVFMPEVSLFLFYIFFHLHQVKKLIRNKNEK